MAISDSDIARTLSEYLDRHPAEAGLLAEPLRLLSHGGGFASRRNFSMHATAGALLTRGAGGAAEVLLVDHRAYQRVLQPGGHLEPADAALRDAALRELTEEVGIDPGSVTLLSPVPVYVEYGRVPARPEIGEPDHCHLDFGYALTTDADIGRIQQSEVRAARWYPLADAERLVGSRIARALSAPPPGG